MFLLPQNSWEIRKTPKMGRGVFATKDIEAGIVVGDYMGMVIKVDQEEEYEKKHGFYQMYYSEYSTIFPNVKAPGVHILNHSCTPNTWMYTYKGHTLYFAIRKIFKGEELTVSYSMGPLDKDCNPCIHLCYCNSMVCQQSWHMPKKLHDKWSDFDDANMLKTKRERVRTGKPLPALTTYPQNLPDHSVYTLFGYDNKKAVVYKDTILPSVAEIRQRIRETGRYAKFPKLNITVYGVMDNLLITQPQNS